LKAAKKLADDLLAQLQTARNEISQSAESIAKDGDKSLQSLAAAAQLSQLLSMPLLRAAARADQREMGDSIALWTDLAEHTRARAEELQDQRARRISPGELAGPMDVSLNRVRSAAEQLGKAVRFDMRGQTTEVDRQIAEGLFEPLLHLVRNAIDHGIEDTAKRATAGKPVEGALSLHVAREGGQIVVTLGDDGAGIDPARIRATAIARGLIDGVAADALSDVQAIRLIFRPGFSTAAAVTGVSGRGVGMDAALAAIERLRGSIGIDSTPGAGTTFKLRLPVHAITTQILVVEVGGDRYGVALDQIVETTKVDADALRPLGTGIAVVIRDRTVPVLDLATLLGGGGQSGGSARLLVTQAGGDLVALRVDGFGERIDTLMRPASGVLAAVAGITGTALTGSGDVLLVLDLSELAA